MNYFWIYLLTRLDALHALLLFGTVLPGVGIILYYIGMFTSWDLDALEFDNKYKKYRKLALKIAIPCAVLMTLVPSRNSAILIIAGGKTLNFLQEDKSVAKIPAKTTEFIASYLDKKIAELDSLEKK